MNRLDFYANIVHQIWSHWMKYFFSICNPTVDYEGNITVTIPKEKYYRWVRQMNTHYLYLPDDEGKSDRDLVKALFPVTDWVEK